MDSKFGSNSAQPQAPADTHGHGRVLAGALLLLLSLGLLAINLIPHRYPLMAPRLAQFDSYQRLLPRQRKAEPVVIVEINEPALATLGQWPWPRQYVAALIDAVVAAGPSAIGMDMLFPEVDRTSPAALAESRPDLPQALRDGLSQAMSNDQILAASMRTAPVVLGAAGFDQALAGQTDIFRIWPITLDRPEAAKAIRNYPHVLASLPQLQAAVRGQALLSSEPEDGVVRRVSLVGSARGQAVAGLAMETLRVAGGLDSLRLETRHGKIVGVQLGDRFIPSEPNGEAWVHFSEATPAQGSARRVSALSLLRGEVPPEQLHGKIVLIGLTAIGLVDTITTPHGDRRPGVDVHAEFLESQRDGRFLARPSFMPWLEAAALLLAGSLMIWLIPLLSLNAATALALALGGLQATLGVALFHWSGWLFDATGPIFLTLAIFAMLMARSFDLILRQKRSAQRALQQQREAAARVAGELEAARRIQLGSLPVAAKAFPGERRFSIEAMLEPAREVGGDLYDFFMLDEDRMLFIVGDVAGKGLPASLFMAVTKALSKSVALRGEYHVTEVINTANVELSRENRETLFVTLLAGVLNAATGELEICNAGHDAPYLLRRDGSVAQLEGEHGPPLCVVENYSYPMQKLQLARGDRLCVITDGVNEAMTEAGELFGGERLLHALKQSGSSVQDALTEVREAVRRFVGSADPSDDLTLLLLQWHGPDGSAGKR